MFKGGCLCGCIEYEVSEFEGTFLFCHCSLCRKASGSAFASNAVVLTNHFNLIKGQEYLKFFITDGGSNRGFCSECGSPIYSKRSFQPGRINLRMGTLETPLNGAIKPSAHIFVGSKVEWDTICDDLPQYDERP